MNSILTIFQTPINCGTLVFGAVKVAILISIMVSILKDKFNLVTEEVEEYVPCYMDSGQDVKDEFVYPEVSFPLFKLVLKPHQIGENQTR